MALRHNAIPVTLAHDVLTVALADPTNVLALDDIRLATKLASPKVLVLDEGLRMVEAEHPDLVLVDLDLPGADPHPAARPPPPVRRRRPARPGHVGHRPPHPRPRHRRRRHRLHPQAFTEPQLRAEVAAILQHRPASVDHPA